MRAKSLLIAVSLSGLVAAGCKATISQKANSGKDYRSKGAKKIKIEDNEGRSKRDVVTYPGGDRVDWKYFEIPEGPRGKLEVRVKHTPPRPGLDVAFNVYDEYFERVGRAKPKAEKRRKKVVIENARPGKYYVQVYAPGRGDAGKYRVRVRFKPGSGGGDDEPEPGPEVFPDPPKLAAVPEPEPEPEKVPCPNDPTKFQPDCPGPKVPCPDDPTKFEPDCPVKEVKPIRARVVNYKISASGGVVVICDKGKKHGVSKGWKGQIVDRSGNAVQGGVFTITRVTSRQSTGKVRLSIDQVKANNRAILKPNQ